MAARSVCVYRLWRDGGFAVGALLAGALADETHPRHDRIPVPGDAGLES